MFGSVQVGKVDCEALGGGVKLGDGAGVCCFLVVVLEGADYA